MALKLPVQSFRSGNKSLKALVNATIHTGDAVLPEAAVLIDGGAILDVVARGEVPNGAEETSMAVLIRMASPTPGTVINVVRSFNVCPNDVSFGGETT